MREAGRERRKGKTRFPERTQNHPQARCIPGRGLRFPNDFPNKPVQLFLRRDPGMSQQKKTSSAQNPDNGQAHPEQTLFCYFARRSASHQRRKNTGQNEKASERQEEQDEGVNASPVLFWR